VSLSSVVRQVVVRPRKYHNFFSVNTIGFLLRNREESVPLLLPKESLMKWGTN